MPAPLPSHLGALREGLRLLRRHPLLSLGLIVLAMVLSQLGPALELAAGVGPNLAFQPLFGLAGVLPLEMYFIPRLMAQLDAEALNGHGNPADGWQAAFDQRWFRSFLARLCLSVALGLGFAVSIAIGFGLFAFLIPAIVILTLYGWTPLRMLLRGDSLLSALKWSQGAMARHWPRIVQAVLAMLLVVFMYQLVAGWALDRLLPGMDPDLGPGALLRLKHPAFWVSNLLGGGMNLWFSAALLALYHRLEAAAGPV